MFTVHISDATRPARPLPKLAAPPFIVRPPHVRLYALARTKGGVR